MLGAISLRSSSHFPLKLYSNAINPVMLPPGRAKLSTNAAFAGHLGYTDTQGRRRSVRLKR